MTFYCRNSSVPLTENSIFILRLYLIVAQSNLKRLVQHWAAVFKDICFKFPTPTLVAFTGVTNAGGDHIVLSPPIDIK